MRITAVEEYGLRCLLSLARQGQGKQLSIPEIAEMEGLSIPYVSKLLSILRRAGLVTAERGRSGGFSIPRPLDQISLYEILVALGGPLIDPAHCQKHTGQLDECVHIQNCSVHDVLGGLAGYVQEFLTDTTLQDLAAGLPTTFAARTKGPVSIAQSALYGELKQIKGADPIG
ncbi:MAG: Rrf2 family transcriptional regulator [Candidatus Zixiibacteriota bacterium]